MIILFQMLLMNCLYSQQTMVKTWDRSYGGAGAEDMYFIEASKDGGYILAGVSNSGISGDKSQPTYGRGDFWIVKIDSNGNYLWDKDYGGSGPDLLSSLCLTNDGGYILAGTIFSDSSYDITQTTRGGADYWILKLDSLGNKQWDRRFGGDQDDYIFSVSQTKDGGYILGGEF